MTFKIPNTLGLNAFAADGGYAETVEEVRELRTKARSLGLRFIVLGSGSNVLPMESVDAFVCVNALRGREVLTSAGSQRQLRVCAGENWHETVLFCASEGLHGLENLALIPGSVGAAPIQNIGAYGVEVSSFIENVEILDADGKSKKLSRADCEFAYRDSIFKRRQDLTVVSITLSLQTEFKPNLTYPDLSARCNENVDPKTLIETVVDVRRSKLPDPLEVPNAGSFFKNPVISNRLMRKLDAGEHKEALQRYPDEDGWKLSAAQLIDRAGWKLKPDEQVACWSKQPLVIFNRGAAVPKDIIAFARKIQSDIYTRFGVQLELEPSVLS